MLHGIYLSAAGALIEEVRQAVIANNLANSSTDGYKSDSVSFRRRLAEAREDLIPGAGGLDAGLDGLPGGVFLDEVAFSRSQGAIVPTGDSFDLALRGDGFFVVGDGRQLLYTRAGSFRRNAAGDLVTADGRFKLLGVDGNPVSVGAGEVRVGSRGEISVNGRPAGRLLVAGGLDPARFDKAGGNYFRYLGEGLPPAAAAEVIQGSLEVSDVSPVNEMVRLIQSHRAYEANLQMARIQDSTLARAASDLPRVTA